MKLAPEKAPVFLGIGLRLRSVHESLRCGADRRETILKNAATRKKTNGLILRGIDYCNRLHSADEMNHPVFFRGGGGAAADEVPQFSIRHQDAL